MPELKTCCAKDDAEAQTAVAVCAVCVKKRGLPRMPRGRGCPPLPSSPVCLMLLTVLRRAKKRLISLRFRFSPLSPTRRHAARRGAVSFFRRCPAYFIERSAFATRRSAISPRLRPPHSVVAQHFSARMLPAPLPSFYRRRRRLPTEPTPRTSQPRVMIERRCYFRCRPPRYHTP